MRFFLTSATGQLGSILARQLVRSGHLVTGLTRQAGKVDYLRSLGIEPALGSMQDLGLLADWVGAADCTVHSAFYHGPDNAELLDLDEAAIAVMLSALRPRCSLILCTTSRTFGDREGVILPSSPMPPSRRASIERSALSSVSRGRVLLARMPCVRVDAERLGGPIGQLIDAARGSGAVPLIDAGLNRLSVCVVAGAAEQLMVAGLTSDGLDNAVLHLGVAGDLTLGELVGIVADTLDLPVIDVDTDSASELLDAFAVRCLSGRNRLQGSPSFVELRHNLKAEIAGAVGRVMRESMDGPDAVR